LTDKKSPNIRINKVYTRTGDAGKTRLIGGEKSGANFSFKTCCNHVKSGCG